MMRSARNLNTANAMLLDGFEKDCQIRKITTYDHYSRAVVRFMRWLQDHQLDPMKVGKKELKDYLHHLAIERRVIHKTLARNFAGLNSFYSYLEDADLISKNPVPSFRQRNLRAYKADSESQQRQVICVEDAAKLIGSVLETQDRAIILLLLKTGIRNHELCDLDVEDLDLPALIVTVKPTPKRSNCELYFDLECAEGLKRWLTVRSTRVGASGPALFLSGRGNRVTPDQIQHLVIKHATRVELHDPSSKWLKDKFTPHCCRHFFTTCLIQSGMPRDFVKELRGDARHDAVDIYNHIDKKELKKSYLTHIPQLGI
jgi:integrase/recombinase XerD